MDPGKDKKTAEYKEIELLILMIISNADIVGGVSGDVNQPHAITFADAGKFKRKGNEGHFTNQFVRQLDASIPKRMSYSRYDVLQLNMLERELRNATSKGYEREERVFDRVTGFEAAVESELEVSTRRSTPTWSTRSKNFMTFATSTPPPSSPTMLRSTASIGEADIIVGPPTAAKKIADNNEVEFDPLIVWSDEAGRVSEASIWLGCDDLLPECSAAIPHWRDPYQGHQLNFSGSGKFKPKNSEGYFVNQMTSANDEFTDVVERFRRFLGKYGRNASGSMLALDMKSAPEENDGPSFLNRTNAGFVVRLVVNILKQELCPVHPTEDKPGKRARVIIIALYDSQRQVYNELFSKLSDAEFVREHVEVASSGATGTAQNRRHVSAAHGLSQAPKVTKANPSSFDTVRSSGTGFLADHENLNACLTRAGDKAEQEVDEESENTKQDLRVAEFVEVVEAEEQSQSQHIDDDDVQQEGGQGFEPEW
ncbi:hypothetical protein PG988_010320 [Apiospora saccharicola]